MMNNTKLYAGAAILALIGGCGSSNDTDASGVKVTELAAGAYTVGAGDAANPVEGKYYAAADGSRLLVLNDKAQRAQALYQREAGAGWQASPAVAADTVVDLAGSAPIPRFAVDAASIAGRYAVRLASGATATLSVTTAGEFVAGDTPCKLSGRVAPTPLPNALKLTLGGSGCGDLPAQATGYLVIDRDYAPAAFRLLATGGKSPVDLWAYPE